MFAYCLNSPTMLADQDGLFARKEVFYIYCGLNEQRPPRLSDYTNQREPQAITEEEQRVFRIVDHALDNSANTFFSDMEDEMIKSALTGGTYTISFIESFRSRGLIGGVKSVIILFALGFVKGLAEGIITEYVHGGIIK